MSIKHDKLFNPDNIQITEDMSEIDTILEFEEILFAISEKIINYRKENNLTQKELADILNVNQTMISKLESGRYNPTFKVIYNISRKLQSSSNMFIDILDNIKTKLSKMRIKEYNLEVEAKDSIIKNYSFNRVENTNLIEIKYDNYVGGNFIYEECTSSVPNVG